MSRSVGIVWHPSFLEHKMGDWHPECPERLVAIRRQLQEDELWTRFEAVEAREATRAELERYHTPRHVQRIMDSAGKAHTFFDADTSASAGSAEAASRAAGGMIELARAVVAGDLDRGMALVRPPGHHAESDRIRGFCLFNSIAIAAISLLEEQGLERILIADWDLHHGNGTQFFFEEDPRVLYFSTHQYPYFPGSGFFDEVGKGEGQGYTINVPLPVGMNSADYLYLYQKLLRPVARQFQPEAILVSVGYDILPGDVLGGMLVDPEGITALALEIDSLASELCGGRLAATLEGGYDNEGGGLSASATLRVLLGELTSADVDPEQASTRARNIAQLVQQTHEAWWDFPS